MNCDICGNQISNIYGTINIDEEQLYLCEDCTNNYNLNELIQKRHLNVNNKNSNNNLLQPKQIKEELDKYIIGQDQAKKILSVAAYNHYKRIIYNEQNKKKKDKVEIQKSNILLLGGTGTGKTFLTQILAKILDVPIAISDATSLTESGFAGDDVESILSKLINAAHGDIELAERGMLVLDEVDKLAIKPLSTMITKDPSGEGVQQGLLKIIEGMVATVPPNGGRKHPDMCNPKINTENILFICTGAFDGLTDIIQNRLNLDNGEFSLGFGANIKSKKENKLTKDELLTQVTSEDLIKYGFIPELIGRLPIVTSTKLLTKESLIEILTKPKNALIKQYQELLKMDDINLKFDDKSIDYIANLAYEKNMGARGLRSIVENILLELMFELPRDNKEFLVTQDMVKKIA